MSEIATFIVKTTKFSIEAMFCMNDKFIGLVVLSEIMKNFGFS